MRCWLCSISASSILNVSTLKERKLILFYYFFDQYFYLQWMMHTVEAYLDVTWNASNVFFALLTSAFDCSFWRANNHGLIYRLYLFLSKGCFAFNYRRKPGETCSTTTSKSDCWAGNLCGDSSVVVLGTPTPIGYLSSRPSMRRFATNLWACCPQWMLQALPYSGTSLNCFKLNFILHHQGCCVLKISHELIQLEKLPHYIFYEYIQMIMLIIRSKHSYWTIAVISNNFQDKNSL